MHARTRCAFLCWLPKRTAAPKLVRRVVPVSTAYESTNSSPNAQMFANTYAGAGSTTLPPSASRSRLRTSTPSQQKRRRAGFAFLLRSSVALAYVILVCVLGHEPRCEEPRQNGWLRTVGEDPGAKRICEAIYFLGVGADEETILHP